MRAPVIYPTMISISVMLATLIQVLDTTIANVALPHMQGSLAATQDQITWVLTSYIVAAAIMTAPAGWLASSFGRRKILLISITGFTGASLLCGVAESLEQMTIYRLLQGAFGAALVPLSQSTLLDTYPKERHGTAMAMWGVGVMVGPILGPIIGGYLTEFYNWRWVFYINFPLGILAFLGIMLFVPNSSKKIATFSFDWKGFLLLSLFVGSLQIMLDRGESKDWFSSTEIIVEGLFSVVGLYYLIAHTIVAKHPFVSPQLFLNRNFSTSLLIIFCIGIILFGGIALLPPLLQNLLDYPAYIAGLVIGPRGAGTMLGMMIVSRLVNYVDARYIIITGLILVAYSLHMMTGFNLDMNYWIVIESGVLQGFGLGLVFVPLTTVAFSTLPASCLNEGTSFYNLARNIGGSIGISFFINELARNSQTNHATLSERITSYSQPFKTYLRDLGPSLLPEHKLLLIDREINRQASMLAYVEDFNLMMLMILCIIPLAFILKVKRSSASKVAFVAE